LSEASVRTCGRRSSSPPVIPALRCKRLRSHSSRPPRGLLTPRLEERLGDEARFIKTWFDNPILTGAVSPSGRFLARTMARAVDPAGTGPIVELGPGTGPITQAMLSRGIEASRLVLVEFDAAFCRLLRKRFPGVQVVQADAYNLRESLASVLVEPAAAVVSSLPLLTKPDDQRLALLNDAFALMAPGGSFVQFTYGMTSPIPRRAAADFEAEVSSPVWFNLPPARVWVYRRAGEGAARTLKLAPDAHPRDAQLVLARAGDGFRPVRDHRGSLFHRVAARAKQRLPRRLP
jgi:phosphatidylethanolamine/phosphatidyl-N-methylethanolamine N-methyltransferase